MPILTYTSNNPPTFRFTGRVIRIEADGFGIIQFDRPIGPSGNTMGIVTSSSTSISPLTSLRADDKIEGTAEADERDVASIKTFEIVSRSA